MSKKFEWKIFFILWAASTFGLIAIIPYSLALSAHALKSTPLPMPLPLLVIIQIIEQAILFGVVIAVGLFFANRASLGIPILEARLKGEPVNNKIVRSCQSASSWGSSHLCSSSALTFMSSNQLLKLNWAVKHRL